MGMPIFLGFSYWVCPLPLSPEVFRPGVVSRCSHTPSSVGSLPFTKRARGQWKRERGHNESARADRGVDLLGHAADKMRRETPHHGSYPNEEWHPPYSALATLYHDRTLHLGYFWGGFIWARVIGGNEWGPSVAKGGISFTWQTESRLTLTTLLRGNFPLHALLPNCDARDT